APPTRLPRSGAGREPGAPFVTWRGGSELLQVLRALPVAHMIGEPGELVPPHPRVRRDELPAEEVAGGGLGLEQVEGLRNLAGELLEGGVLRRGVARR